MSNGQQKMPLLWEAKIDHPIVYTGTGSEERELGFVASDEEITVFDHRNGQTIWSKKYININSGLIEINDLICYWQADALILISGKGKTCKLVCVDIEDGILLWQLDGLQQLTESNLKYLDELKAYVYSQSEGLFVIDAHSGHEIFHLSQFMGTIGSYVYNMKDQTLVIVNMNPEDSKSKSEEFENQIAKIDLVSGKKIWENSYKGITKLELMTKEPSFQLSRLENKIILSLEGLQIYDYNSGHLDWTSIYNCSTYKLCKKPNGVKKFGVYNHVAFPRYHDKSIFAFIQNEEKITQLINYDIDSKELIWSIDLGNTMALPKLEILSEIILVQNGGAIETQAYVVEKSGDYFIYKWLRTHPIIEPSGISAIDLKTGQIIWTIKDSDYITNSLVIDDSIFLGRKNSIISINKVDGSIQSVFVNDSARIGEIKLIHKHRDNVIIAIGEKGISSYNVFSNEKLYSSTYKELNLDEFAGDFVVMKGQKDEAVVFDAESGHYKFHKSKSTELSTLSANGKYLYVYGKKSVRKLRAN